MLHTRRVNIRSVSNWLTVTLHHEHTANLWVAPSHTHQVITFTYRIFSGLSIKIKLPLNLEALRTFSRRWNNYPPTVHCRQRPCHMIPTTEITSKTLFSAVGFRLNVESSWAEQKKKKTQINPATDHHLHSASAGERGSVQKITTDAPWLFLNDGEIPVALNSMVHNLISWKSLNLGTPPLIYNID